MIHYSTWFLYAVQVITSGDSDVFRSHWTYISWKFKRQFYTETPQEPLGCLCNLPPTCLLIIYDNRFFLVSPCFHVHTGYITCLQPHKHPKCFATPSVHCALDCTLNPALGLAIIQKHHLLFYISIFLNSLFTSDKKSQKQETRR